MREMSDFELENVTAGKLAGVAAVELLLWPLPQMVRGK